MRARGHAEAGRVCVSIQFTAAKHILGPSDAELPQELTGHRGAAMEGARGAAWSPLQAPEAPREGGAET